MRHHLAFVVLLFLVPSAEFSKTIHDVYTKAREYLEKYNLGGVLPNFGFETVKDWTADSWSDRYDFVIVGSGSAGAVIANRLSEIPEWNILLLEAGKPEGILSTAPMFVPLVQLTDYNWDYLMEYQENFARGMENRRAGWPRGRALGGTSVINYMIYTRGNPKDFDRWASAGNPGWSYKDVLPYYMKSERARLGYMNRNFHNASGLWAVEDVNQTPLTEAFIGGGNEMGYSRVDYATNQQIGFGTVQANVKSGSRHSVAKAFLEPIRGRKNLHVYTSARVTRILLDETRKVAYGVEFLWEGKARRVYARKEVILSAGAFASPQLLMLSGIGPRKHLEELKIKVVQDLPVGQNLQDHITYVGLNFLIDQDVGVSLLKGLNPANIYTWLANGTGVLTSLGGVSGIGYIKTEADTDPDRHFPDVELIFVDGTLGSDFYLTAKGMKVQRDIYLKYWGPIELKPKWTIFPMLLHPRSVGYLKLRTTNPLDDPVLVGNYYSDREGHDLRTMIASIRFVQDLGRTRSLQRFQSRLYDACVPGCEGEVYDSDGYWRCALETFSISLYHQIGTCKMGPVGDQRSVVDNELRVKGIGNLRVADTSVIPNAIGAHTNAPSVMIGEKTADIIKRNWRK